MVFPSFFHSNQKDKSKSKPFHRDKKVTLKSSPVGPKQAQGTGRRYDRMAEEGYAQNVIAYRAISMVARSVAAIPLLLKDSSKILDTHPLLDLLCRPNPSVGAGGILSSLVSYYLIAGNAYMLAVGPKNTAPRELWCLRPDTIKIKGGANGLPHTYIQRVGDRQQNYDISSILHWKEFNPLSDWYGQSPLEAAALAIDQHNEGARWNLALIQNGGTPSGVLYQDEDTEPLTDTQLTALRQQISETYSGSQNAGRPLLLEGGLKWQETAKSPKDLDWLAGMTMSARDIATAFGVPSQMLGIPDSQTYANYAEARASFWEDTIIPLAGDLIGLLNQWLCPRFGDNISLQLDLDHIPALEEKRHHKFQKMAAADFLTDNEKRIALGFPSQPSLSSSCKK